MPTPDQARIETQRAHPRITELWWALRPLTSVVRFMQTGAHPDDEISGMLAALAFRDGVNISYACSTRGEGGQNDVGTEAGAALGALRTREMERACDVLGMRMYWHSETPEDPITDFGFSKSGDETLGRWGHARTLARFVDIVREERPDIMCPTFLDVPGQHGHHRAMTQAAHEVMTAAADPAYPSNRPVWQVKKMYLPAWSGAGQAYDDDLPPPPATMTVPGAGEDAITGWSWDQIGQQSRAYHRTQGMGRWVAKDDWRDWPLHLAETHVAGPDDSVFSGLPTTLADLAAMPGAEDIADQLASAQASIDAAVVAFPAFDHVATSALKALAAVRTALENCPDNVRDDVAHRLQAKEVQLGHVIRLALGVDVRLRVAEPFLVPGQSVSFACEISKGQADAIDVSLDLPRDWSVDKDQLIIDENAAPTAPYRVIYDPAAAEAPAALVKISHQGKSLSLRLPMENPPMVLPNRMARVSPDGVLINLADKTRDFAAHVDSVHPDKAKVALSLPDDWQALPLSEGLGGSAPSKVAPGLYTLPVHVNDASAMTVQRIEQPHTAPTTTATPAALRVLALDAKLPDVTVGYVGAGNDRVNHWLSMLGADMTDLTNEDLTSDTALQRFDTIVIGIFAMRFRPGLSDAMARLHAWARAGGTLVTLYHRPWDNWDPDTTPPHRLEIGQPSLRWRVTDEAANVRHLSDHPLLSTPNQIGPDDWAGWVKERGLYFAKSWDAAYAPLIEMADPGEDPHQGALLVADVGAGRHVHTSLILHHQMENLVPGAFRLMANLIAKRG
jgi:LmbE family N-acetylglucosaminyl deacetylase